MTDRPHDDEDTQRTCPECSDAFTDPECPTCRGKGMVTAEEFEAWRARKAKR